MDLFGYFECRWNEPSLIIQIRMEKFDAAQQNNVLKDSLGYSEFRGNVPLLKWNVKRDKSEINDYFIVSTIFVPLHSSYTLSTRLVPSSQKLLLCLKHRNRCTSPMYFFIKKTPLFVVGQVVHFPPFYSTQIIYEGSR